MTPDDDLSDIPELATEALGELIDRRQCNHFGAILAPEYRRANWKWSTGKDPSAGIVPFEKWIADVLELLRRDCADDGCAFSRTGGLMVIRQAGRYMLKVHPSLTPSVGGSHPPDGGCESKQS